MKAFLKKSLLTAIILFTSFSMTFADGWKLKSTTVYGNGGYWQDNQKTRIDCAYKKGVFQYERKVTVDKNMYVYSAKAEFAEPKQVYGPGEDIAVRIAFTQSGDKQSFAPYARVTVMNQNPQWKKGNGPSNKIPASGNVDGQATDAGGRNAVMPPETVTLMAQAPSSGSQMAIVYSCNGMDVVYLYNWDGKVTPQPTAPTELASTATEETNDYFAETEENIVEESESASQETDFEPAEVESETGEDTYSESYESYESDGTVEESVESVEENDYNDEETDTEKEGFFSSLKNGSFFENLGPYVKYIIVGVVALLLIVLILFVFKKKDKTPKASSQTPPVEARPTPVPPVVEQPAPQNRAPVCPKCGAPIQADDIFCQECGQKLK